MFKLLKFALVLLLVVGAGLAVAVSAGWLGWPHVSGDQTATLPPAHAQHQQVAAEQVKLSPQAQRNLGLTALRLEPGTYWKTISLPGAIEDRPGFSDRGVASPVTAVVTKIHKYPGDMVSPGDPLFTLRLVGESFHTAQTELFKAAKEIEITREQRDRLAGIGQGGAIPQARVIELDNELRRLAVVVQAYRQDLQIRGLTPDQIDGIAAGKFVSEITVEVPQRRVPIDGDPLREGQASPSGKSALPWYELQELKVDLGRQVQPGEVLCLLSHHQYLYVVGQAFSRELPLVQRAAEEGWPIRVELVGETDSDWSTPLEPLTIHHLANTMNPASGTVAFYLPLENQHRTYQRDGRTLFLWRFRPGQRVRLNLRVDRLDNVFVLPTDAVVREGPEAYVFRQNGDWFERKPVHVVYRSPDEVVVANDGSLAPGVYVAASSAVQLNRVLKSQSGSEPAGFHVHADGSVHVNH